MFVSQRRCLAAVGCLTDGHGPGGSARNGPDALEIADRHHAGAFDQCRDGCICVPAWPFWMLAGPLSRLSRSGSDPSSSWPPPTALGSLGSTEPWLEGHSALCPGSHFLASLGALSELLNFQPSSRNRRFRTSRQPERGPLCQLLLNERWAYVQVLRRSVGLKPSSCKRHWFLRSSIIASSASMISSF